MEARWKRRREGGRGGDGCVWRGTGGRRVHRDVAISTLFVGGGVRLVVNQLLLCWSSLWTPGAPIVINDSQLCRTMAEAPRRVPHHAAPQLLFLQLHNKHSAVVVVCLQGCFCFLMNPVVLMGADSPLEDTGGLLLLRPASRPLSISKVLVSSSLCDVHLTSCFLLPSPRSAPEPPFVSLSPASDSRQGLIHAHAFTFFHPVIYAVRGFPPCGWPGFHVCAEVLTCSFMLTMKQTVAGNRWGGGGGVTATGA